MTKLTDEQMQTNRASVCELHCAIIDYVSEIGVGHNVGCIIMALVGASSCFAKAGGIERAHYRKLIIDLAAQIDMTWGPTTNDNVH